MARDTSDTDRRQYQRPDIGDAWAGAWDDLVEDVDEVVVERGPVSNRPASGAYNNSLYLSVDTDELYRWNQSAGSWEVVLGFSGLSGGVGISPSSIADGDTLSVAWEDANDLDPSGNISVEPFAYDPGMTEFEAGLSSVEINRLVLGPDEALVVERIEFREQGGGSAVTAAVTVRDETTSSTVGIAALGDTTRDPGTTPTGNTIIVEIDNGTGGTINAAPRVSGYITEV